MNDIELYRKGLARPRIYVSGPMAKAPYTGPRAAFQLAQKLWQCGWHPVVPHGNALWEVATGPLDPSSEDGCGGWIEYDFSLLGDCMYIVRVGGEMLAIPSTGTDREHAVADHEGIIALTAEQCLLGAGHWFQSLDDLMIEVATLPDALSEADDALRKLYPDLDHTLSVADRIALTVR